MSAVAAAVSEASGPGRDDGQRSGEGSRRTHQKIAPIYACFSNGSFPEFSDTHWRLRPRRDSSEERHDEVLKTDGNRACVGARVYLEAVRDAVGVEDLAQIFGARREGHPDRRHQSRSPDTGGGCRCTGERTPEVRSPSSGSARSAGGRRLSRADRGRAAGSSDSATMQRPRQAAPADRSSASPSQRPT